MKIPKEVKVGSSIFKIVFVDELEEGWLGETIQSQCLIKIRKGKKSTMEKTFIHELIHCINASLKPENMIENLANSFHLLLKDNPKIFR